MKSAKKILLVVTAAFSLGLAAGCTNPVADTLGAPSWGLAGSWINPAAYGAATGPSPTYCYHLTLASNGTFNAQTNFYPDANGTFRIDGVSTNANARQFKIFFQYSSPVIGVAALVRVTDGSTYEVCTYNPPTGAYPSDIIQGSGAYSYSKYSRQ